MSKRQQAGTPWVYASVRVPEHGQEILLDYVRADGKNTRCVGRFDGNCGWILHGNMRLPEGWKVINWMPIPEILPF